MHKFYFHSHGIVFLLMILLLFQLTGLSLGGEKKADNPPEEFGEIRLNFTAVSGIHLLKLDNEVYAPLSYLAGKLGKDCRVEGEKWIIVGGKRGEGKFIIHKDIVYVPKDDVKKYLGELKLRYESSKSLLYVWTPEGIVECSKKAEAPPPSKPQESSAPSLTGQPKPPLSSPSPGKENPPGEKMPGQTGNAPAQPASLKILSWRIYADKFPYQIKVEITIANDGTKSADGYNILAKFEPQGTQDLSGSNTIKDAPGGVSVSESSDQVAGRINSFRQSRLQPIGVIEAGSIKKLLMTLDLHSAGSFTTESDLFEVPLVTKNEAISVKIKAIFEITEGGK